MSVLSKPVLVFGAGGQVGYELVHQPSPAGFSVIGLTHAQANICDRTAIASAIKEFRPAIVVNAAAYTAVDKAENDAPKAFSVNEYGAANLARAAFEIRAPVIHISTDYVFDGSKAGPYFENDPVAPLSVYGRSKEAGERAVRSENPDHIILRTSWVYSSRGNNFVKTMLQLAAEREFVRVVSDQHGTPTSAADLAQAIHGIIPRCCADAASFGTFHWTNSGHTTWYGLAARIFRFLNIRGGCAPRLNAIATTNYPVPAARPKNLILDCSRVIRTYGVEPRAWEAALDDLLESLFASDSGERSAS